jgi:hypothetical protein
MATQIVGNVNSGTAAEVEVGTKALRSVIRPDDIGSLGAYLIDLTSGTMAAALAANSPVFSWRNGNASNVIVIRQVQISAGDLVGFTAGIATFTMFRATSFSASDTGGTTSLPGTGSKKKTSMASSLMTAGNNSDIRISATATLTAGTRTLDALAMGTVATSVIATAGNPITPGKVTLFDGRGSAWPLVLVQNEGFVIQATVPITGTWTFDVQVDWEELTAYP